MTSRNPKHVLPINYCQQPRQQLRQQQPMDMPHQANDDRKKHLTGTELANSTGFFSPSEGAPPPPSPPPVPPEAKGAAQVAGGAVSGVEEAARAVPTGATAAAATAAAPGGARAETAGPPAAWRPGEPCPCRNVTTTEKDKGKA